MGGYEVELGVLAIAVVAFGIGFVVRRWWIALLPLVLWVVVVLAAALSDTDGGELTHEGVVILTAFFYGIAAALAFFAMLGGVAVGRCG